MRNSTIRILLVAALAIATTACKKAAPRDKRPSTAGDANQAARDPDATFWAWFVANADRFRDMAELVDVMETVGPELERTHAGVIAEIEKGEGGMRVLVLTADGDKTLFPTIQRLAAAAPAVDGWKVVAFRQPMKDLSGAVIEMNGKSLDLAKVRFVSEPDGKKVGLHVFVPGYVEGDETMEMLGFIALDHAVGEYAMETHVSGLAWYSIDEAPAEARPLAEVLSALPKE